MDTTPKTEEERAEAEQAAQAQQDLDDIAALKREKAFERYFVAEAHRLIAKVLPKLRLRTITENDRQFVLGQLDILERWRDKLKDDAEEFSKLVNR